MENIFKDAKFGEIYISRDETECSFCSFTTGCGGEKLARLYRKDWGVIICHLDGSPHSGTEFGRGLDFNIKNKKIQTGDDETNKLFAKHIF